LCFLSSALNSYDRDEDVYAPGSDEVDPVVDERFAELAVGAREAAAGERVDLASAGDA